MKSSIAIKYQEKNENVQNFCIVTTGVRRTDYLNLLLSFLHIIQSLLISLECQNQNINSNEILK